MSQYPGSMEAGREEWIIFHGHPSWRSMLGLQVKGFLFAVGAGVLAGVLSTAADGHVASGWVILAVLAVFLAVLAAGLVRRRRTTYTITSQRLTIEDGLLGRRVHETRLEQVQDVSCSQSLVERALGVGCVSFETAGGGAPHFSFRGVAHPRRIVRTVNDALRRPSVAARVS
jgi:uncharacterized membrane protein YdbT with pleckstrin-like domain